MNMRSIVVSLLVMAALVTSAVGQNSEPIGLHPENPHYFLYQGKAVALITSGEHYGAVLNGDFDYHKYLATLTADGMNYTRLFGGSYVELPGKSFTIQRNDLAPAAGRFIAPWKRSDQPGYAGGGNKFDLNEWNPEYFTRLRDFLGEAERHAIVVEITLFSSQYGEMQWNLSPFLRANNLDQTDAIDWKKLNTLENGNILGYQEKYARALVREANRFGNVIFEICNEPWSDRSALADVVNPYLFTGRDQYPNSVDLPDEATMAWQARVGEWIRSEEAVLPHRHLIAQDCCNFRYPLREVPAGVSVVNFHYAYAEAASLNYGLGKALSYDETGFLGRDDAAYARQAWNFMLSGGGVFDSLDYSFSVGHEDGSDNDPNGPGGGSRGLRLRLKILSEFLRALPLVEMKPDFDGVTHAGGIYAHALSSTKEWAIYLDGKGPTEISLRLPAGEYSMTWVNVVTGEASAAEKFHHAGGVSVVKTPEFREGIALRVIRR